MPSFCRASMGPFSLTTQPSIIASPYSVHPRDRKTRRSFAFQRAALHLLPPLSTGASPIRPGVSGGPPFWRGVLKRHDPWRVNGEYEAVGFAASARTRSTVMPSWFGNSAFQSGILPAWAICKLNGWTTTVHTRLFSHGGDAANKHHRPL